MLFLLTTEAWGYTVTSQRPRIWLSPDKISGLQTRCITAGQAKIEFDRIKTWVDTHISDTISGISLNSQCKSEYPIDANHMGIHLMRTAMVYKVDGSATYGQRVTDLLYWLAQNGTDPYGTSAQGGDQACGVYFALAVAFDWCYDQLDYAGGKSAIISYLDAIVTDGVGNNVIKADDHVLYVGYKTEEPYHLGFVALALHGESGVNTTNVNECISRFDYYWRDLSSRYDESGYSGGLAFTGSYVYTQILHRLVFFELWRTATDEDPWTATDTFYAGTHAGSDNARFVSRWLLWGMRPDGAMPYPGDAGYVNAWETTGIWWPAFAFTAASRYNDAQAQFAYNILEAHNPDYSRGASWLQDRLTQDFYFCLWHDPAQTAALPSQEAIHFGGIDNVFMRSGWNFSESSTDIYFALNALTKHDYGHWSGDFGHYTIARGNKGLLVDSGKYLWNDADHYENYHSKPWAHNTIIVDDQDFVIGVNQSGFTTYTRSASPQALPNKRAAVAKFQESKDNYAFTHMVLTDLYHSADVNKAERFITFMDDKYIVVYDRVEKDTPGDTAKLLFHTATEPARASDDWVDVGADCFDDKSEGLPVVAWTHGSHKAHWEMIAPTGNITMRQSGGPGCEFLDMSYVNHPLNIGSPHEESSTWRFDVWSTAANATDEYLYVIEPTDALAEQQPTEPIDTIDADYAGVQIRASTRCAVLYAKDGIANKTSMSFTASDTTGTIKVLIFGMASDTYTINGAGSYHVGADGVLYYTADLSTANSFTIVQSSHSSNIAGVTVSPTNGLTTSESGTIATFTVVLDTQPLLDVRIDLNSSNPNEGAASPTSLTFTEADWSAAQTVTVTGVDDGAVDGDQAYTIIISPCVSSDTVYDGIDPANVLLTNLDDDSSGSGTGDGGGGSGCFTSSLGR